MLVLLLYQYWPALLHRWLDGLTRTLHNFPIAFCGQQSDTGNLNIISYDTLKQMTYFVTSYQVTGDRVTTLFKTAPKHFLKPDQFCILNPEWTNVQTFSSSRVNPRPARTRVWYLNVGQWTIGRRGPATGLGMMAAAFFLRLSRRRFLRAGWLNQDRTNFCQSLWKCPLGIILFPFPIFVNLSSTTSTI